MREVSSRPRSLRVFAGAVFGAVAALCLSSPAVRAQEGLAGAIAQHATPTAGSDMVLKSREMIYDNDRNTVTALGDVQIYYDGRVLQADRVVYDRKAARLKAFGNVRITEKDGTLSTANEFDLTDDFKEGFVNSLLLVTPDKTRFASQRAERVAGNITVFQNGVYTACEPCKDNPEKPPLWQVKAARIIHNDQEKMVYFEDARLEFLGIPIAYVPYFSSPDPTVKRKSGVLTPGYFATSQLGVGVEVPYFFALAPNYDLTITPGVTTKQGPTLKAEWRHRVLTGSYSIRAAGAFQLDPGVFSSNGNHSEGDREFRGTVDTKGEFAINKNWVWGWDATVASDKYFREDYNIDETGRSEAISTLYLTGTGNKSFFDARLYYFLGLTADVKQKQEPLVHPVIDYDYVVDHPVMGGELGWNVNLTSLSRENADFDSLDGSTSCDTQAYVKANPGKCIQRGIDGTYTRLSGNLYWKKAFTDPIGQIWTPFAYVRGDMAWTNLDLTNTPNQLVGANQEFTGRLMPAIGLEYRYPLISQLSWGTQVLEPVAQVILRPRLRQVGQLPNEDSQSLVFDDTNLFAWDKFSGYDRLEDGSRVNAGLQYSLTTTAGAQFNALVGQSLALGSKNPYSSGDMSNTGLDSGLDKTQSDYVTRFYAQPSGNASFAARMRFDQDTLAMKRLELTAAGSAGRLSGDVTYGRYAEQPALGLGKREGIQSHSSLKLDGNWTATGGFLYDLDAKKLTSATAGLSYLDECYSMSVTASRSYASNNTKDPVDKVMLLLSLRTLGDASMSRSLSKTQ